MPEFRPSAVKSRTLLTGVLGNEESELAAMCVVGYLAAYEYYWETEFTWRSFATWMRTCGALRLHKTYFDMLAKHGSSFISEGVNDLVIRGYMRRRDSNGVTYLEVLPKLVEVMRAYATV